jgi:hypothetical protein
MNFKLTKKKFKISFWTSIIFGIIMNLLFLIDGLLRIEITLQNILGAIYYLIPLSLLIFVFSFTGIYSIWCFFDKDQEKYKLGISYKIALVVILIAIIYFLFQVPQKTSL